MKLYNFFRSGTSHRLRIALNLKGVSTEYVAVDLRKEEHLKDEFAAINPQMLVPALVDGPDVLIQSTAIIEWLEERYPTPPLLPSGLLDRARVRAMASVVGCDIHPALTRWKPCSPPTPTGAASASATRRVWWNATSSRRWKVPAASRWTWRAGR